MLNIAIGLALLVGVVISPGSKILNLFVDMDVAKNALEPYQIHLMKAGINFWVLAVIFYLLLNVTKIQEKITPTKKINITIGIANLIIVTYIVVRVFASTIEGGGASFVVASLSLFTLFPSLILLAVSFGFLIKNSFSKAPHLNKTPKANSLYKFLVTLTALIPLIYIAQLVYEDNSVFKVAKDTEKSFLTYCKKSGEKIFKTIKEPIKSLYIDARGSRYTISANGKFGSSGGSNLSHHLLVRGDLSFVEFPNRGHNTSTTDSKFLMWTNVVKDYVPIASPKSRFAVISEELVTNEELQKGLKGEKVSIIDWSTNETIAQTVFFTFKPKRQFCGYAPKKKFSTLGFIKRVFVLEH